MTTLDEIETAAASLSPAEKQELLLFLSGSLRGEGMPLPEPRKFTTEQMARWVAQDEADAAELDATA